jgi:hypothetical protein
MHKSATKCNEILGKWCKSKHGASKIIDMLETYHLVRAAPPNGLLGPIKEAHDVNPGHRVHCHSAVEDLLVIPISAPSEGMEGADFVTEVIPVVLVLGQVAGALSFQACPLHLLERVAVRGGMIRRCPRLLYSMHSSPSKATGPNFSLFGFLPL